MPSRPSRSARARRSLYQQRGAIKGNDSLGIDYTGRASQPGTGTIFLRRFGSTAPTVSFFAAQGTAISYEQTPTQLLASLRAAGAVGYRPARDCARPLLVPPATRRFGPMRWCNSTERWRHG